MKQILKLVGKSLLLLIATAFFALHALPLAWYLFSFSWLHYIPDRPIFLLVMFLLSLFLFISALRFLLADIKKIKQEREPEEPLNRTSLRWDK